MLEYKHWLLYAELTVGPATKVTFSNNDLTEYIENNNFQVWILDLLSLKKLCFFPRDVWLHQFL